MVAPRLHVIRWAVAACHGRLSCLIESFCQEHWDANAMLSGIMGKLKDILFIIQQEGKPSIEPAAEAKLFA